MPKAIPLLVLGIRNLTLHVGYLDPLGVIYHRSIVGGFSLNILNSNPLNYGTLPKLERSMAGSDRRCRLVRLGSYNQASFRAGLLSKN